MKKYLFETFLRTFLGTKKIFLMTKKGIENIHSDIFYAMPHLLIFTSASIFVVMYADTSP
jgi:hypothetical protein